MKFVYKKAFTFIELVISLTIFFILVSMTYVPYNFYMNKLKVKNTIKEISNGLYEARNMAINWFSNWTDEINKSVWLYIDIENKPSKLQFFSYPYNYSLPQITNIASTDIKIIKTYDLIKWMEVKSIEFVDNWATNTSNNWLFFYNAIVWDGQYFYWDASSDKQEIPSTKIKIKFSYKNAPEWNPLFWELTYFTETNIVDY